MSPSSDKLSVTVSFMIVTLPRFVSWVDPREARGSSVAVGAEERTPRPIADDACDHCVSAELIETKKRAPHGVFQMRASEDADAGQTPLRGCRRNASSNVRPPAEQHQANDDDPQSRQDPRV